MSGDIGPPDRIRLPGGVTEAALRDAVARNRSWRGVLRHFGMSAPRNGRVMRSACDELGIPYDHFSGNQWDFVDTDAMNAAVASSRSWPEVANRLGYAEGSGSAMASLRRVAVTLGLEVGHLSRMVAPETRGPFDGPGDDAHLRRAAAFIVAAKCTLLGHGISWPLEPEPYDLLVHTKTSGLLRVQVKSGTHLAHGSWVAWITRRHAGSGGAGRLAYTADEIDYFGIVDAEHYVYMLPISLVAGQQSVTLRKYEDYRIAC
ncbi:MAG: hypothetical protein QOI82_2113 [Actinomycetota bacterium]|nr:hypothetical protein [Actinomycetota bacterium]